MIPTKLLRRYGPATTRLAICGIGTALELYSTGGALIGLLLIAGLSTLQIVRALLAEIRRMERRREPFPPVIEWFEPR